MIILNCKQSNTETINYKHPYFFYFYIIKFAILALIQEYQYNIIL